MSTRRDVRFYSEATEKNGNLYLKCVRLYKEMHSDMYHFALEDDRSNILVNIPIPDHYVELLKKALRDDDDEKD